MGDATGDDTISMELCFITEILANEPLKKGSLFSADFSYIITSFQFWRQGA